MDVNLTKGHAWFFADTLRGYLLWVGRTHCLSLQQNSLPFARLAWAHCLCGLRVGNSRHSHASEHTQLLDLKSLLECHELSKWSKSILLATVLICLQNRWSSCSPIRMLCPGCFPVTQRRFAVAILAFKVNAFVKSQHIGSRQNRQGFADSGRQEDKAQIALKHPQ